MKFLFPGTSVSIFRKSGGPRTRFSAEKPRRLQQSTGLLPRAAFRVHFGFLAFGTRIILCSWLHYSILYKWWAKMDSNHRPHDYQSCALASWAIGPYFVKIKSTFYTIYAGINCSLWLCFSSSPSNPLRWALPGAPFFSSLLRYILSIPCKLNNASSTEHFLYWP